MDILKINELAERWDCATDQVIQFENPGFLKVRTLFRDTLAILEKYRTDKLVPKEISGMLLEMNSFGWWVSDLKETPLHDHYQEIVSLIFDLNQYFLTCNVNTEAIMATIEKIDE
ncbi:MAG: hypothetical protein IJY82_00705 [Oscillospiraceae bacterium]|nr:hypothetical protein [Oscillospiraceae bacterium]